MATAMTGCGDDTPTTSSSDDGYISATINGVMEKSALNIDPRQAVYDTVRNSTTLTRHRTPNSMMNVWFVAINGVNWRTATLPLTVNSSSSGSSAVVQFVTSDDTKDIASKKSFIAITAKPTDSLQVTVTEVSRTRIKGTFRGNLYRDSTQTTARIADGTFDVPLLWSKN
jgi:hypothetical protein